MGSSNKTGVEQNTVQKTTPRLTLQQRYFAELIKMGDDELGQRVDDELSENEALELDDTEKDPLENDRPDDYDDGPYDKKADKFDKMPGDDEGIKIDDTPTNDWDDRDEIWMTYDPGVNEPAEIPIVYTTSFVDDLRSQISDHNLADEKQAELVKYLIGSLNDNGYLDRPLASISDDLSFYENIDASKDELEAALGVLQSFDPPGIGARDLQECMLLQLDRKIEETPKAGNLKKRMVLGLARQVVAEHFDIFKSNNHRKLFDVLNVEKDMFYDVLKVLLKLNPRPGLSLNETADGSSPMVTPDFFIETDIDGNVSFDLRNSRIPQLRVSQSWLDWISESEKNEARLSKSQKKELEDMKSKVIRAESFIEAIRKRRETLYRTMKAIIRHQHAFILSQDDNDLLPLTQEKIAEELGVDISTISRATSDRYAQLNGTLYPLKMFFLRKRRNTKGEDVLGPQVKNALQYVIDHEDKSKPLSDDKIREELENLGISVKRRTVQKYRDQLGIPKAAKRKSS